MANCRGALAGQRRASRMHLLARRACIPARGGAVPRLDFTDHLRPKLSIKSNKSRGRSGKTRHFVICWTRPPNFEFGPTVVWPLKSSARTLSSRDFGIFCLFPARCFLVRVALPWVCVMPRIASRAGYARVPSATGRGCAKQLWRVRARQLSPPGVCRIKTFVSRNAAPPRNSSVPWQARQSSQSHG